MFSQVLDKILFEHKAALVLLNRTTIKLALLAEDHWHPAWDTKSYFLT